MQLEHKIAIITGASSGLGAAASKALIEKGAKVYGLARNEKKLKALQEKLGENFHPISLDITHEANVSSWVENTFSPTHLPHILINNAGVGFYKKFEKTTTTDWMKAINTNLNGTYYITAAIVPWLKKNNTSTHIINVGSILGSIGQPNASAYCTTKFGIEGFSEVLFKELRDYNIKVTCLNPGSIATDFFSMSGVKSHENMLHPEDLAGTITYLLETPDNLLIDKLTVRPLNPKRP